MNIIGRLTRDAKVNTLPNEKQVVNFSVAVNDSYKNKQGERVQLTEYFNCAYWISPNVAKVLTKGALVELTGRVSAQAWLNKEGKANAALHFHTSQIKLYSGRNTEAASGNNGNGQTKTADKATQTTNEDLPF
ncbi:MAG: single-stranded DNA-binding protein [Bacteroidota bacterium]|nr:single-stranded DNA-binding protein [Bacteroidota bacterium]